MTSMLGSRAGLVVLARMPSACILCNARAAARGSPSTATAQSSCLPISQSVRYASTGRKSDQVERAIRLKTQEKARKKREARLAAPASSGEGSQELSRHAGARRKEGEVAPTISKRDDVPRLGSSAAPMSKLKKIMPRLDVESVIRPAKGSKLVKDEQGRLRVIRSETRSIRDAHFKVANRLEHLISNRDLTPLQAYEEAQLIVEKTPSIMRREPRIYNLYVRHALRAGKKRGAFKIIDSMKKNGCAVTGQTYIAVFSNMRLQDIDPEVDKVIFQRAHSLYQHMLSTWRAAQEFPEAAKKSEEDEYHWRPAVKPYARRVSVEQGGTGYKTYDPRFLTGRAYEKTAKEAYEGLLNDPDLFVRACDEYICLLLKHDDVVKATEMLVESEVIVQISRSQHVASLPRVLASRVVEHYEKEKVEAVAKNDKVVGKDDEAVAKVDEAFVVANTSSFDDIALKQELQTMAVATIERHRASLRSIGNDDVDTFRSASRTKQGGRSKVRSTSVEHRQRTIISDRIDDDGPPGFNPYSE